MSKKHLELIAATLRATRPGDRSNSARIQWWDTVDGFGSTAVSPLCWRYDASDLVWAWSGSPNIWLNRAAIQHQRGWKNETNIPFVLIDRRWR